MPKKQLAVFFLLCSAFPALAGEQEKTQEWEIEAGTARRAGTVERFESDALSYGFSCWKRSWVFFFNYQAPEGGKCDDHAACEKNLSQAELTFRAEGMDAKKDQFNLFENYYFQANALSTADMEAFLKAGKLKIQLDEKLKQTWQKDELEFPLGGFEQTVTENAKILPCPLHVPVPVPTPRPTAAQLLADARSALHSTKLTAKRLASKAHKMKRKAAAKTRRQQQVKPGSRSPRRARK